MRHIGDVVDDLAAVGAFDQQGVPLPVGPLVGALLGDLRDAHLWLGRVALMVVPDEQQSGAHVGVPRTRAGQFGSALGVGHQGAPAVTAPAPVVERTRHRVALDGALREVAAHVPAVAVEHAQLVLRVGEHHQLGAEGVNGVRFSVEEVPHRAQAVPAPGIPVRQGPGVDLANVGSHVALRSQPLTRTRYSFLVPTTTQNRVECDAA